MTSNKIILISCVARKGSEKALARDLYKGPLFTNSLAFANSLRPDKILILSALYHVVELNQEIEPYDVTLSYVSPKNRAKKPNLKVLRKPEVRLWGEKVLDQLGKLAEKKNDEFIILAGKQYIEPIKNGLSNIVEPLKGLGQGKRVKFLQDQTR